uniref:Uncharacterized protein n=1 Tax=Clytia hemisphaerica TaxID=252671 RepID=A0A7M5XI69_9CNID
MADFLVYLLNGILSQSGSAKIESWKETSLFCKSIILEVQCVRGKLVKCLLPFAKFVLPWPLVLLAIFAPRVCSSDTSSVKEVSEEKKRKCHFLDEPIRKKSRQSTSQELQICRPSSDGFNLLSFDFENDEVLFEEIALKLCQIGDDMMEKYNAKSWYQFW